MLKHLHAQPRKPARVAVLGAHGFIAGAILRRLMGDSIATISLGRPSLDLLKPGASDMLARALSGEDCVVFVSAKAPCRDLEMLRQNLAMAQAVCAAIKAKPVAHVVYISSDAVYKDSTEPLDENSCAEPGSLHGVMHLAREVALRSEYPGPLAIVRPTLVYGADDPHNGYGPNRFRRLAMERKDIVLFGDGEERRDHVDVADIAELVRLIVLHRSYGIANAVSGQVASFRELAEFVASEFKPRVAIRSGLRSGPMPHNGYRPFDNRAVLKAFPAFQFKSWREGLSALHRQLKAEDKR